MRWKFIWLFLVLGIWWEPCFCLRGSELVLQAKAKAAEEKLNPTTEEVIVGEDGNTTTVIKKPLLTGIPQKDYIHDPNLPRELKGHNLTNYPFYNSIPEEIEFACDGLHDGFYASVPHHCQVYHHCLYGTRYDFLCANYTAFDQKTFICHFVSEVDCVNSPKYFVRNEALYKAASTAPPPTTTTTAPSTTTTTTTRKPKRRRPARRRRPLYEYYYDSEEYDDEYYDEEEEEPPPRKGGRKQRPHQGREKMNRRRPQNSRKRPSRYEEDEYEDEEEEEERPRMRKGNRKEDDYRRHRNRKGGYRDDDDFRDRPSRGGSRKRHPEETRIRGERRPPPEYEYYDDEEEEKYDRRRPSRKPDKRERTTTKKYEKTTEAAEEEYEEYEDEEEDLKPKKKNEVTTLAPHRFSTTGYKSSKPTTTRPSTFRRQKPAADSERRYRPLPKRVETSTEEPTTFKRPIVMKPTVFPDRKYTSLVGTPAGFKKQDERSTPEPSTEPYKEEEKTEAPRRPFDNFRKQNFRRQQDEDKKEEKANKNSAPPRREESNYRPSFRMKENINSQRTEATPTSNGRNPYSVEEEPSNSEDTAPMVQEPPAAQSEENISSMKNPTRDENSNFRKYANRGHDYSGSRNQETLISSNRNQEESTQSSRIYSSKTQGTSNNNEGEAIQSRYKDPTIQNGRTYPSRTQVSSSNEGGSSSSYKEENIQNGRIYPSRSQQGSYSEENSNGYRTSSRNEEQNYRSNLPRQEDRQTENPNTQFRNSYSQEERVSNYRNPTAIADDVDYRNPSVSNEETNTNYRSQPSGSGNANYRNPHASSDESQYRPPEDNRFRLSNVNDPYQRPETHWPPKDQTQYLEPSPQPPPLEDVKPYLTGPGSDQSQEGKSSYPSAVTSPARGYRRYTKMKVAVRPKPVTEESVEYNKYPIPEESPKVEFTAPGPSAPQATPRPYLDIEEYDVTLNDALQPSTPYSRLKSRYQPAVTHPSYRTGFLLTSASQTYPTKLGGEYEAVVLPAQRFSSKRRPQEWYW